jgi:hypothetical protein
MCYRGDKFIEKITFRNFNRNQNEYKKWIELMYVDRLSWKMPENRETPENFK